MISGDFYWNTFSAVLGYKPDSGVLRKWKLEEGS